MKKDADWEKNGGGEDRGREGRGKRREREWMIRDRKKGRNDK